jgi:hypothetical protein
MHSRVAWKRPAITGRLFPVLLAKRQLGRLSPAGGPVGAKMTTGIEGGGDGPQNTRQAVR